MADFIPLVFCVDAEPDEFIPAPDRPDAWRGYLETHRLSAEWRRRLEDATGHDVAFSWFVRSDPQVAHVYGSPVWAFEHYEELLLSSIDAGDEIGLHVHLSRWSVEHRRWLEDFSSSEWAAECVRTGLVAYRTALGVHCRSVRLGNHWMNREVSDLLERLGVRHDLTAEPGALPREWMSPLHTVLGSLPDYRGMPTKPFRRSAHSHLETDDEREDGLFVLPVSTASIDATAPRAAREASDDGAYLRLGLWYPNEAFRYVFESNLSRNERACLVLAMRSDMPLVAGWRENILENIAWLVANAARWGLGVCSPRNAIDACLGGADRSTVVEFRSSALSRERSA